jgi:hypothetical protein
MSYWNSVYNDNGHKNTLSHTHVGIVCIKQYESVQSVYVTILYVLECFRKCEIIYFIYLFINRETIKNIVNIFYAAFYEIDEV